MRRVCAYEHVSTASQDTGSHLLAIKSSIDRSGVDLALEETAHLPIPAGIGLEDAELGRVVGNGRD